MSCYAFVKCRRNMLLHFNVILDASCKFSMRRNYIYDPYAGIIKNPLNSITFWTRRLNSATRQLNSATPQILHWIIVAYFDESSSQLVDASTQLRDASKMLKSLHCEAPSYVYDLLNWYHPNRHMRSANTTALVPTRNETMLFGKRLMDTASSCFTLELSSGWDQVCTQHHDIQKTF